MAAVFKASDFAVRRAARLAYERGRFEGALWRSAAAAAFATPAFLVCNRTPAAAVCLLGFGLVLLAARVVGKDYDRGARAGALAGVLPCLLPAAVRALDPELCATMFHNGAWFCGIGGAAAGVILGVRSRASHGVPFWAGALAALGFAASLGCLPAGAVGFAGLLLGVIAGGAPVLVARRVQA